MLNLQKLHPNTIKFSDIEPVAPHERRPHQAAFTEIVKLNIKILKQSHRPWHGPRPAQLFKQLRLLFRGAIIVKGHKKQCSMRDDCIREAWHG